MAMGDLPGAALAPEYQRGAQSADDVVLGAHDATLVTLELEQVAEVRDWLADNPRIKVHFTPTSGSWMNLVEVWFGIIERQAIHRGTFGSVKDLNAKIRAFIEGWNDRCHPFVWTKTADEILKKANRPTTSVSGH